MDAVSPRVFVLHNRPANPPEPSDTGVLDEVRDVLGALRVSGFEAEAVPLGRDDLIQQMHRLRALRGASVVFNLCEGLEGEARFEATVAGLLELHELAFTGNSSLTLAWALDKRVTKAVLAASGVHVATSQVFRRVPAPEVAATQSFPMVVKPVREDSSLGITGASLVRTPTALRTRVEELLARYRQPVLAEAFLPGREFNVAVLGEGRDAYALPVAEIEFVAYAEDEPRLVTHAAKWDEGSSESRRTVPRCPADIPPELATALSSLAVASYRSLECRDYARVDLRLDRKGRPHVLEVNPNPDVSQGAGLARAVTASGQGYPAFIAGLVELAWQRR